MFSEGVGISADYVGTNEQGIEVYETSEEVKNLSWKERKNLFLRIMRDQYRGRTAKFMRNGHPYYAKFEYRDVSKNIYGDDSSDQKGRDAKINVGADGNIFELVENAKYLRSEPESGKDQRMHRGVNFWDYFVKTVQIDGNVFDIIANVRKKSDGEFVYVIEMNENKEIEPSSPKGSQKSVQIWVPNGSDNSIEQESRNVNKQFSISPVGKAEEQAQEQKEKTAREKLDRKGREYLSGVERKMVNSIAQKLNVPYVAKRETLMPIMQKLSDTYLETGRINSETEQ